MIVLIIKANQMQNRAIAATAASPPNRPKFRSIPCTIGYENEAKSQ
jgi:hypothetical protein